MRTRRAFLIQPGRFELREMDIALADNQILVKVVSCGLCHWELNHWHGILGTPPMSLGHEYVGNVVDVGKGVAGVNVGQVVTGLPTDLIGFADYATFNADSCFVVAPSVPPEEAIGEPLKCIVTVLRAVQPEVGDYGVVIGCGPMGIWSIQGLANKGLAALIAVDLDDERLTLARAYGATATVNPSKTDLHTAVKDITDGHNADFAIEGTGLPGVIESGMDILKRGRGRLILMSSHEGPAEKFDFRRAIDNGIELRVAHPAYSLDQFDDMRRAVNLLNRHVFDSHQLITHRFKLDRINEAFTALENRPKGYLKGIVLP